MGTVAPGPDFNAGLRRITENHGALLIMDEVMTGFRVSRSGWYGIDHVAGDLVTFGKVMSGGMPAAAFGGRADIMDRLAPLGPVYQAGTLSGNPVAVAAGLASLRAADAKAYETLDRNADALIALLTASLDAEGWRTKSAGQATCSASFRHGAGAGFPERQGHRNLALSSVLPCSAEPRCVPSGQRVRDLVRLHRPR